MHPRLFRSATVAAGLTGATSAVCAASATALTTRSGRPAGATPVAAYSALRAAPRTIVLIGGDEIISATMPGGARFADVVATAKGIGGALITMRLHGKTHEVPAVALPYLGRGLDPSLFDVSALIARETGGLLPVRVGFQGRPPAPPALPGVRVTHYRFSHNSGRGARVFLRSDRDSCQPGGHPRNAARTARVSLRSR
jgi:hypothetical protein